MMSRRAFALMLLGATGVAVLGLVALWVWQPRHVIGQLSQAVVAGEEARLWDLLDQVAIRKAEVDRLKARAAEGHVGANDPLMRLGEAMAPLMMERQAWELGTPASLLGALRLPSGASALEHARIQRVGLGRVRVVPEDPQAPSLELAQQGLAWRVVRVDQSQAMR